VAGFAVGLTEHRNLVETIRTARAAASFALVDTLWRLRQSNHEPPRTERLIPDKEVTLVGRAFGSALDPTT
jgi:hypothetical protein